MDKREFIKTTGLVAVASLVGILPSTARAQSAREIAAAVIKSTKFNGRITVFDGRDELRYGVRIAANGKNYNRTARVRKVDAAKLRAMLEAGKFTASVRAGDVHKSGSLTAQLRGDQLSGAFSSDDNQGEYQTQVAGVDDAALGIALIVTLGVIAVAAIAGIVVIETGGDASLELKGPGGSVSIDLGGGEGEGAEGKP